jgi:hypothetical protein
MSNYASMIAIGKKLNLTPIFIEEYLDVRYGFPLKEPFKTPIPIYSINDVSQDIYQVNIFPRNNTVGLMDSKLFNLDPTHNYHIEDDLFSPCYFFDIMDEVLELYTFKDEITSFCSDYINQIKQEDEILVSIHFRRGDYLIYSSLNLSLDYYKDAVDTLKSIYPDKKIKYLIFSNGMEWVKENFKLDNCVYVENLNRFQDMCLMSLCDHNIIANSSFSLWGAFLNKNPNKTVICPFHYLTGENSELYNGYYYPKNWIDIKTI